MEIISYYFSTTTCKINYKNLKRFGKYARGKSIIFLKLDVGICAAKKVIQFRFR
jgi:hypothetical protein